ncbi:MAG: hypothetical protein ACYCZB_16175 [Acidiphilium sp.]
MSRTGRATGASGSPSNRPMVRQRGLSSCSATPRFIQAAGHEISRECRLGV